MKSIKVIGFDADDTLWVNGSYFSDAEASFCALLSGFMSEKELSKELFQTEMKNMEWYGYGAMAYTLSLIETAIRVSHGKVSAKVIGEIVEIGRSILDHPIELFPGVNEILPILQDKFRLIVITKGDLLDQERKLEKSGLLPFFHHIEVVTEKRESNYLKLIKTLDIQPSEFLMVGNSLKSDILPVLAIGAKAVFVPFHTVWQHETAEKPTTPFLEIDSLLELPALLDIY
jgi:putative hydrolase of the HAD superfamily